MKKEMINPAELYQHPAYSRIVTVSAPSKFHFIAGLTAADENYKCVAPGDYLKQYYQVMEGLDLCLKKVGATWDDVVFRRIYVLNMDEFIKIQKDESVTKWFTPGKFPPSTLIEVTRLSDPEFLIEIDLLAVT